MALIRHTSALLSFILMTGAAATSHALAPSLSITDSHNRHNLSVTGPGVPGVTRAFTEARICIFCHTPHHATAVAPLWSRDLSLETSYKTYYSTTLNPASRPGQPTGASRLCLSCHDGTVAPGMLAGGYQIAGLPALAADRVSNLSTDLSDDHPVSFPYPTYQTTILAQLQELPPQVSLEDGRIECTSCHDPHMDQFPPEAEPTKTGKFLVLKNEDKSALCTACHTRAGLDQGAHFLAINPCGNCHAPHRAPQPPRLLKGTTPTATCFATCHNGSGTVEEKGKDIQTILRGNNAHRTNKVIMSGQHDAGENPLEFTSSAPHVECVDCHNPCLTKHESDPLHIPPLINGRLVEVTIAREGDGTRVMATREYEICFKCHGADLLDDTFVPAAVPRLLQTGNERMRFDLNNPSFHPVMGPGKSGFVPSLRSAIDRFTPPRNDLTTSSIIYCTDCHNSNTSVKAGGSGPSGPHASDYPHILIDDYETDPYPSAYSESKYNLCWRCRNQNILLSPASSFPYHESHLKVHLVPCFICHDPHGVYGGTVEHNSRLINFQSVRVPRGIFTKNASGGTCMVSCHPDLRTY